MARLIAARAETATARSLVLAVPGWPGHLPGQHVDLRLTAEDGYSTQRSYSVASAPDGQRVELTVQRIPDGEVSPFLVDDLAVGDLFELRGPVGGWFVWDPVDPSPILLVAGGSGVVPLMAMIRTRRAVNSAAPFRLLYSMRSPEDMLYATELSPARAPEGVRVTLIHTRTAPTGSARPPRRLSRTELPSPDQAPLRVYVCGPTGFVETVARDLVELGHRPDRIRTERFGPNGA